MVTLLKTKIVGGGKPSCYSCREKIDTKNELRITTEAIVTRGTGFHSSITLSFHANAKCLLDWNYHNTSGKKLNLLPAFNNTVALSPYAKLGLDSQYLKQLDELEQHGISMKIQSSFKIYGNSTGE